MRRNSDMASAWAPASGDIPLVPDPAEPASAPASDVPEPDPDELGIASAPAYGDDACHMDGPDDGWLSVGSARWARVARTLLRVYALDPLFWHNRIGWAKRDEALAAARLQLARGQLQLQ